MNGWNLSDIGTEFKDFVTSAQAIHGAAAGRNH
jgi:hypothetical protein